MDNPKLTKTLPEVKSNTLPRIFPKGLHGWLRYDFGTPDNKETPTLILNLEFVASNYNRSQITGSYKVRFEFTTEQKYNPLQICQIFHKATQIGIEDFKTQFSKEDLLNYPINKIKSPSFEDVFPALKKLFYPPEISGK